MTVSPRHRALVRLFMVPAMLALSSAVGLAAGLLGDGIWDAVSWLGLGLPLAAIAWHWSRADSGRAT